MCLGRSTLPTPSPFNPLWLDRFSLSLHSCFSEDIAKWCKINTKTGFCFQKSHVEFGKLQTSSGTSKKLKFDGLLFSKIYIFFQLKHCIQRIYLTLLSNTCVKIHQIPYAILGIISLSHDTTSFYFFSSKITILSKKLAHRTANFHTFHCCVKIHQIPHVIFQTKS